MGKLDGRIAIVTGAAHGMGRAFAAAFAGEGASVVLADRDAAGVAAAADQIADAGGHAIGMTIDVTESADAERLVETTISELGGLHILVNNAGIGTSCAIDQMSVETWHEMIETNLTSVFYCTKAALPTMIEQRYGRIVNMASQLALKGGVEMAHYCAAKAGVLGLTKALARELAPHGITVNAIAPGPVDTEMLAALPEKWLAAKRAEIPLGRFGRVEELVPTALLLVSDDGTFYTGSTLNVSGGDVM